MCSILHGPTPIEGKCENMSLLRGCDPFQMIRIIHMWPHGGVQHFWDMVPTSQPQPRQRNRTHK